MSSPDGVRRRHRPAGARRGGRASVRTRRAPVERHGLRRLAQQPGAAHRGRAAATRTPACASPCEKAEIERLAAEWREDQPGAPSPCCGRRRRWPRMRPSWLALARSTPSTDCPPATTIRRRSSCTSTTWRPRSTSPAGRRLDGPVERGARRLARSRRPSSAGARHRAVRVPERVAVRIATWRWRLGLAPDAARHPALRPRPLGGGQRSPQGGRLEAGAQQRGGVRGRTRGGPLATMSPRRRQELALGSGRRRARRRGRRRHDRAPPAVAPAN